MLITYQRNEVKDGYPLNNYDILRKCRKLEIHFLVYIDVKSKWAEVKIQ